MLILNLMPLTRFRKAGTVTATTAKVVKFKKQLADQLSTDDASWQQVEYNV